MNFSCSHGSVKVIHALTRPAVDDVHVLFPYPTPLTVSPPCDTGACVDATDMELGFTPLMFACSQGSVDVVHALIRASASVHYANGTGITALLLASRGGYAAVVTALLRAGAHANQCDSKGSTPLMVASVGGFMTIVEALLRAGAATAARNYEGYTASSAASEFGQHAIVEVLRRHGDGGGASSGARNGNLRAKGQGGSGSMGDASNTGSPDFSPTHNGYTTRDPSYIEST